MKAKISYTGLIQSHRRKRIMNEKKLLSIKEAAALFGIGQHRLREMVREDYDCRYHLMIGRIIRIKRQPFEKFIDEVEQI